MRVQIPLQLKCKGLNSHSQSILTLFPGLNSDIVILSEVLLENKGRSPNSVSNCTKNPPYVSLGLVWQAEVTPSIPMLGKNTLTLPV